MPSYRRKISSRKKTFAAAAVRRSKLDRERLRVSFSRLSALYDKARPDYPLNLVNDILLISEIPKNGTVLEIGTGSGKATKPFAERGYKITAVDISSQLIAIAKKNLAGFRNVNYAVCSFEKARLLKNSYNLVFSAQAFHWIDLKIGFRKANEILKPSGHLALFSNFQSISSPLEQAVRKLYIKHCPNYPISSEYGTLGDQQRQFEESGLFQPIQRRAYLRALRYSKKGYLNLINSFSWVSTLPLEKKEQFFRELVGLIENKKTILVPTESILLIAKKK